MHSTHSHTFRKRELSWINKASFGSKIISIAWLKMSKHWRKVKALMTTIRKPILIHLLCYSVYAVLLCYQHQKVSCVMSS